MALFAKYSKQLVDCPDQEVLEENNLALCDRMIDQLSGVLYCMHTFRRNTLHVCVCVCRTVAMMSLIGQLRLIREDEMRHKWTATKLLVDGRRFGCSNSNSNTKQPCHQVCSFPRLTLRLAPLLVAFLSFSLPLSTNAQSWWQQ